MNYFKPNWYAINKAIAAGELKELRKEESKLKEAIQAKVDEHYKAKRQKEIVDKIAALKALPIGSQVFYIGKGDKIKFGEIGVKVRDGRTRMIAEFNGKKWSCPYTNIKQGEITASEQNSHDVTVRLTRFVNKHLQF